MSVSKKDTEILRELAKRYMEVATLPVQKEKVELWKALNRCDMKRPMVVIDQLPWNELNVDNVLDVQVEDTYWREVERQMRMTLYKWEHFSVDMVVEPFITIPSAVWTSDYGMEVKEIVLSKYEDETASAHSYINQIKEMEDVEKIKDLVVFCDQEETNRRFVEAKIIFDGIAPVKASHGLTFHLGLWDRLAMYMGVEAVYYDLIDRPELIHAAMDRITNATLHGIKMANDLKVHNEIANTCHCSYTYTDELLPDFGMGKGSTSNNSWACPNCGQENSQESFVCVECGFNKNN